MICKKTFYRNLTEKYSSKFGKCKDDLYSFLCQLDFISHKSVTGSFELTKIDFTAATATLMYMGMLFFLTVHILTCTDHEKSRFLL